MPLCEEALTARGDPGIRCPTRAASPGRCMVPGRLLTHWIRRNAAGAHRVDARHRPRRPLPHDVVHSTEWGSLQWSGCRARWSPPRCGGLHSTEWSPPHRRCAPPHRAPGIGSTQWAPLGELHSVDVSGIVTTARRPRTRSRPLPPAIADKECRFPKRACPRHLTCANARSSDSGGPTSGPPPSATVFSMALHRRDEKEVSLRNIAKRLVIITGAKKGQQGALGVLARRLQVSPCWNRPSPGEARRLSRCVPNMRTMACAARSTDTTFGLTGRIER